MCHLFELITYQNMKTRKKCVFQYCFSIMESFQLPTLITMSISDMLLDPRVLISEFDFIIHSIGIILASTFA